MKSKITGSEKNTVNIEVTVDKKTFEEAVEKSYKKNAKSITIPGFRKGKAPRRFIEKYYGEGIFYEDAINFVYPDAYDKAVEENNLEPVDRPEIDIVNLRRGEDFVFSAKITVKPEFDLPEYKGVILDKIENKVLKADVDREIGRMLEQNSRLITVENRAAKKGDTVEINYEGFVDDVPFEGGKGENHSLELGSGQFIPGFEDQLIGKKTAQEVVVNVKFPEDYHAEELKGKDARFNVTINAIKKKELPKKDDEFAKDVSEFDTLAELEADVRKKLEEAAKNKTLREKENKVLEVIAEGTTIDIPECMINEETQKMMQDFGYKLSQQGLSFEQYLEYSGIDPEGMRDQFKENAAARVKQALILEKIAGLENIEATDEDAEKELQNMADTYRMDIEKVRSMMKNSLGSMKDEIRANKTLEFLAASSKVKKAAAKKTADAPAE